MISVIHTWDDSVLNKSSSNGNRKEWVASRYILKNSCQDWKWGIWGKVMSERKIMIWCNITFLVMWQNLSNFSVTQECFIPYVVIMKFTQKKKKIRFSFHFGNKVGSFLLSVALDMVTWFAWVNELQSEAMHVTSYIGIGPSNPNIWDFIFVTTAQPRLPDWHTMFREFPSIWVLIFQARTQNSLSQLHLQ